MENPNKLKQFPILITLIIAMSGWLVNNLITNIKGKPLIEYTVEQQLIGNNIKYNYSFINVSSSKPYKDLEFSFHSMSRCNFETPGDTIDKFYFRNVRFISYKDIEFKPLDRINDLQVSSFQPNARFDVSLVVTKESKIKITYKSPVPLMVVEASLETFFLKNETTIFFWLLLIYALIMGGYLLINYKKF